MCELLEGKSESLLILTSFYQFNENNVKSGGQLIMHDVVTLIAKRKKCTCTNWPLSQLLGVMCLMSNA
ncbi:hypothetical protein Hanom_Chr13g01235631 [Helianthus anomalus]